MKTQAGIEQMILEGFCSAFLYVLKKNVISEYQIKRRTKLIRKNLL